MKTVALHPDFGVEIQGITLLDIVCSDTLHRQVRELFEEHSVVVLRGQDVSDDIQATFARGFGALEKTKVGSGGAGTFYSRMNNIGPDGTVVAPSDRAMLIARANQLWHTDSSFKKLPALASVLSARVIPEDGGGTEFVSTRAAWAALPEARRAELQDLEVMHSYATSRDQIDPTMMGADERAALPPVTWRLTWRNPVNGRSSLYLASHAGGIAGMDEGRARALLRELMDFATAPQRRYVHTWQPGDVVMWDNRATMHRGQPWKGGQPRSIVRVTISADESDGIDSVRPRAAAPARAAELQGA
ncbi:MAG: TauD/TfdA family dioxygenase [Rhodocyclaceae bacterium]|nr:TauD/TfdA family dioxygenase [Pseudomonadota bacterium]MDQ7974548.1 TauD/TfdA family dioxygenase [Rhodocyclaceae bacterium]MDQ8002047.1 TauD/TfdA family dioxygenase [Pseudomonadota bacterium]MDQ8019772.1 TauD/TfdA family dioxygenase [Pseudomonadota bacterium]